MAEAAIVAAPGSNKKRRLSDAKKDSMKLQLASLEEEKMLKEKLAEVAKQLKGASYDTLLAVSTLLQEKPILLDKTFPRCVKYFGGASNRAAPMKVVIEAVAAMTKWEVGSMRSLPDHSKQLRWLYLYALGKEGSDELPENAMSIKKSIAWCIERYQAMGCRLGGLSIEGKGKGVNRQGADKGASNSVPGQASLVL